MSPTYPEINWLGLDFSADQFAQVTHIDKSAWEAELVLHKELFQQLSYHLPQELKQAQDNLEKRLALV